MGRTIGSKEMDRKLTQAGFAPVRQKGSHLVYRHADGRTVVVPAGRRELRTGTLRSIYRQAGFTWPPE